jgi:DNA polymerase elongation subunit (family B)
MNYLYLDIETIPAQSPEAHEAIAATVKPPAQMKKAETIAAWEASDKAQAVQDAIAKTSLDGTYGHICCIGFAIDDEEPLCLSMDDETDEADILQQFVECIDARSLMGRIPTVVGHNLINFDIRFIWQRAIILGVRMPGWFPRDPKPWGNDTFDTMTAFAGQRGTIGMDRLCQVLGIAGKGDIDGSMVGQLWAEGRHDEIAAYCKADIERTRAIHRRMMVAFGEVAA